MRPIILPLLAFVIAGAAPPPDADRAGWIADFETAKNAITRTSPNLEWQAARGLDLAAIEARARRRLADATTPGEAKDAFQRFLRPFADGHMELVSAPALPGPTGPVSTAPPDCASLGIEDHPDRDAVATRLPGYRALSPAGASVPAGMIAVGAHRVGILRIALFAPSLAHCRAALARNPLPTDCDEHCRDAASARIDDVFLAEVAGRLRALKMARVSALVVDLADNGGGNDTAIAIARMLGGANIPSPPLALARTPATARALAGQIADLDRNAIGRTDKDRVANYRALLVTALAQARRPCDLSPLWQSRTVACTNLVGHFYAGGLDAFDLSAADRARSWATLVSATANYHVSPARWPGPLLLLVNGNSASATELLVAMLQDANRATVIGTSTFGAGCGFTRPPAPVALPRLGVALNIPDCARFRRDGTNEIDRIKPDIAIPFREFDTPRQQTQRLMDALSLAVKRATRSRPGITPSSA